MDINIFKVDKWQLPGLSRKKPTVLVVEDNKDDSDLMRLAAEAEGLAIVAEKTAEAALGLLHKNGRDYIAVFVDVGLPYMDGWSLAQEINRHWPTLTVCVMSGNTERLCPPKRGRMYDVLWKDDNFYDVFRQLKQWKNL